jgi:hypothetical protein
VAFEAIKELLREQTSGDIQFLQDLVYYFELRVPASVAQGKPRSYLFPLILGPEEYELDEPFSVVRTPAQGSGLWTEENGIVERTLTFKGTTGWKPREYKGSLGFASLSAPAAGRSHARTIPAPFTAISGHRHFLFLEDAVFRTYGDLKRDPATSEATKLFFHIPRDDDHWEVRPVRFRLTRKRMLYYYDIELLVVGPAEDPGFRISEDASVLDAIRSGVALVSSGINLVRATVQDVVGVVDELERLIKGIGATVASLSTIVDAASDFVSGVTDLIRAPLDSVINVISQLDDAIAQMDIAVNGLINVPDTLRNTWRQAQVGLDYLAANPHLFEDDAQRALQRARDQQTLSSRSRSLLISKATEPSPSTVRSFDQLGTNNLPGDLRRSDAELHHQELALYSSVKTLHLRRTDTIQALAARYLGDARRWQHITSLNGLRPPYISSAGVPGTLGPGDAILIPSTDPAPDRRPVTPVFGVSPSTDPDARVFGTDLTLEDVGGQFDFAIDTNGGSTDLQYVAGEANLIQALYSRLRTERGTDLLYQQVGVDRVVATLPALEAQITTIRVGAAIRADPRIAAVRRITVSSPSPDNVELDIDAEVTGASEARRLTLSF